MNLPLRADSNVSGNSKKLKTLTCILQNDNCAFFESPPTKILDPQCNNRNSDNDPDGNDPDGNDPDDNEHDSDGYDVNDGSDEDGKGMFNIF